jgi:cell division septation protein DedD
MSREAELYKDKIEVSLDGRQIFYLFFGGAVIVGLVFVLGVMVGRRVEARGHVDRARVAATVDPLAALDRLEGGTNLSFQGALRGGETPESDVEKQIAAMQKATDAAPKKADAKKAEAMHDEPKAEPKKADAELKKSEPEDKKVDKAVKSDEPKVTEKKSDDKKADAKKDDAKTEAKADSKSDTKTEAKTEAKKSDTKTDAKTDVKKDDAKKTADASVKADEKPATEEKKQKYTLQLSSFQDKREAEAYLDSIKSSGYEARMTEGTVDGKQYFRVRMGSYRSVEAANDAKAEFEKGAKKSAIVTRL